MSKENYRQVAKRLGLIYLFGRWGLSLGSKLPGEHRLWSLRVIPLDGWITDQKEVERIIRENGLEL